MSSDPALPLDPPDHQLDRALPGWAVDAIRDGIPGNDARRVYAKCVSIAMSAHLRGWTENQFVNAIADTHSRLWTQLMMRRDGRTSSLPAAMKALRKAWSTGVANAADVGCRTRDEIRADAVELAYQWSDRLDDRTDKLSATETAVMTYVVQQTIKRGMFRVTCPRRVVAESAGIGEESAKGALVRLVRKGVLVKYSAGRSGEPGKGKAAIFGLPALVVEHPIDTGSIPMGCSGSGSGEEIEVHQDDTPETVTSTKETPHRDTTPDGTPHREVAGLEEWIDALHAALADRGVPPVPQDVTDRLAEIYAARIPVEVVADRLAEMVA